MPHNAHVRLPIPKWMTQCKRTSPISNNATQTGFDVHQQTWPWSEHQRLLQLKPQLNPHKPKHVGETQIWENQKNWSSENRMRHYLKWPESIQHPAAPRIQLPLSASFPFFAFPLIPIRFNTQPPSTALTQTPSSQILPKILHMPHSTFLRSFGVTSPLPPPSPNLVTPPQISPPKCTNLKIPVHGLFAQFSTVRLFEAASLWNGRRVLKRRSRRREYKQKERSSRPALSWCGVAGQAPPCGSERTCPVPRVNIFTSIMHSRSISMWVRANQASNPYEDISVVLFNSWVHPGSGPEWVRLDLTSTQNEQTENLNIRHTYILPLVCTNLSMRLIIDVSPIFRYTILRTRVAGPGFPRGSRWMWHVNVRSNKCTWMVQSWWPNTCIIWRCLWSHLYMTSIM